MNTFKSSNHLRLIAFFLVAVILICTFGFTVDGWSFDNEKPPGADTSSAMLPSPPTELPPDTSDDTPPENSEPEIYIPKFTSYITGLEVSAETAARRAIAVIMDASNAAYSISLADLIAEFPIEDGSTRLAVLLSDLTEAGKIGAIDKSRKYISNLAYYFDAIALSYGTDDALYYDSCDVSKAYFDLKENSGYHYSEFAQLQYTNADLLEAGLSNLGITTKKSDKALPYRFNEFGEPTITADTAAESIRISFSQTSLTELVYSQDLRGYTFTKSGKQLNDKLNGKSPVFTNCFVLFADSVTYEDTSGTQMVLNTLGEGIGYYFTNESVQSILWQSDADGNMSFYNDASEPLIVNRGKAYIAFVKSSRQSSVSFE